MAQTVGQHQQASFTSPANGESPIDADVVRGNDNNVRSVHNAHDSDQGIHIQSGLHAARPAAGTAGAGATWLSTDTGRLYYTDGVTWSEVVYLRSISAITAADVGSGTFPGSYSTTGTHQFNSTVVFGAGSAIFSAGNDLRLARQTGDYSGTLNVTFTSNLMRSRVTGNATLTPVLSSSGFFVWEILQGPSGPYTVAISGVTWASGTPPTITATANRKDLIGLYYDGTNILAWVIAQNFASTG